MVEVRHTPLYSEYSNVVGWLNGIWDVKVRKRTLERHQVYPTQSDLHLDLIPSSKFILLLLLYIVETCTRQTMTLQAWYQVNLMKTETVIAVVIYDSSCKLGTL